MEKEWLTFNEACEHLRQSRPSMYRLIKTGKVKPYKIPGQRRSLFKKIELDALPAPVGDMVTRTAAVVAIAAKHFKPTQRKRKRT
jgi:excisionase family DNA binding protein